MSAQESAPSDSLSESEDGFEIINNLRPSLSSKNLNLLPADRLVEHKYLGNFLAELQQSIETLCSSLNIKIDSLSTPEHQYLQLREWSQEIQSMFMRDGDDEDDQAANGLDAVVENGKCHTHRLYQLLVWLSARIWRFARTNHPSAPRICSIFNAIHHR
jgi:hypothetical protein